MGALGDGIGMVMGMGMGLGKGICMAGGSAECESQHPIEALNS